MLATTHEFLELIRRAHAGDTEARARATEIVNELLRWANKVDDSIIPFVRAWLDAMPDHAIQVLKGDPSKWAPNALVDRVGRDNPVLREAVTRRIAQVQNELSGPSPSPIERLLAERVAFCWADAYELDWHDIVAGGTGRTLNEIRLWQLKRDNARRRLLTSIKALVDVRRKPSARVRVNVGTLNVETDRQEEPDLLELLGERSGQQN